MMTKRPIFAPDFFVVGAAKAGTTAVSSWLQGHPQVFLPLVKEPGYFAYVGKSAKPSHGPFDPDYISRITVDYTSYQRLYSEARERLTGDVSPIYLIDENAAERIASVRPDARIIVLLRDPVKRAFSQFLHHVRDSLEPCNTFEAALDAESERLRVGWSWGHGYATHGHYASQIEPYLSAFPSDQILFLEFESLQAQPQAAWNQICAFLGLKRRPLHINHRVNATSHLASVPSRPGIGRALRHPGPVQSALKACLPRPVRGSLRKMLEGRGRPVPTLNTHVSKQLSERYRFERHRIEAMTGLSLDHWTAGRADYAGEAPPL